MPRQQAARIVRVRRQGPPWSIGQRGHSPAWSGRTRLCFVMRIPGDGGPGRTLLPLPGALMRALDAAAPESCIRRPCKVAGLLAPASHAPLPARIFFFSHSAIAAGRARPDRNRPMVRRLPVSVATPEVQLGDDELGL